MISQLVIELNIAQTFKFAALWEIKKAQVLELYSIAYNRVQMIAQYHDMIYQAREVRYDISQIQELLFKDIQA